MTIGAATAWMADASCVQRLDLPWTTDAGQVSTWDSLTMTLVCDRCPVTAACAGYADTVNAEAGFWAGAHRDTGADPNADQLAVGAPSWAVVTLPGLASLGGAA